jgi:hypothetical protein
MIYLLQYVPASSQPWEYDPISLPWVASDWMTKDAIVSDFEARFPGNRVVSLEPLEVTA